MNKETLDDKKIIIEQHGNYIILGNEKYYALPPRLLDYIKNLEKKYENAVVDYEMEKAKNNIIVKLGDEYRSTIDDLQKHCLNQKVKIKELEQENEELNRMCEIYSKSLYNADLTRYKSIIDKAIEIYKNRNTCKYKKERFMEDKSTSDLMYETLTGGDE